MSNEPNQVGDRKSKQNLVAALDTFRAKMEEYCNYTMRKAQYWSAFYWSSRSALIVFGILTSTDALNTIPLLFRRSRFLDWQLP